MSSNRQSRGTVLVLGATSGIAEAVCHELASHRYDLIVAGRREAELSALASDLAIRHNVQAQARIFDALAFDTHPAFIDACFADAGGRLEGVIQCHGYMTDQDACETDLEAARLTVDVNLTSAVTLLTAAGQRLKTQGSGFIVGISSVAGDRGRQSNYTYGAAKAGLSTFLAGLRNRLTPHGVHVMTVKPGFVYTAMTEKLLDPNKPIVAKPPRVARDIVRALHRRQNVLYTPWFWRIIMAIIVRIPESAFKRMKM